MTELDRREAEPMSIAEQIDAINRKRNDEYRRADLQHDKLIQSVRDRCNHEPFENADDYAKEFWGDICKHCGADMSTPST